MDSLTLILIPTGLEARRLDALGGFNSSLGQAAICGFGPVAAAARTMQLLLEHRPRRALLVGVAGTYDAAALPVGAAACFGAAAIDGVGAGSGEAFLSAGAMGFAHWTDETEPAAAIGDRIALATLDDAPRGEVLVTACAAAGGAEEVAARRRRWSGAAAEDMEAFGVALACRLAGAPLAVVRGVSNEAGDRDPRGWRIDAALAAARALALRFLQTDTWRETA
jgi:futalosine hydrolase